MRKKHKRVSGGGMKDSHCTSEEHRFKGLWNHWLKDIHRFKNQLYRDSPCGTLDRNMPANAGGTSSGLAWDDPTCSRATQLVCHNYWAHPTLGTGCHKHLKPAHPWPVRCSKKSHHNKEPSTSVKSNPLLAATREDPHKTMKKQHSQKINR